MTRRTCAGCKIPWLPTWPACEACGCPAFVAVVAPEAVELEPARAAPRPVALSDVKPQRVRLVSTGDGDVDAALGGGLATCGSYLLSGGPGAGKSTLALRALARVGGIFISCEMPPPLVRATCERAGIPTNRTMVVVPDLAADVADIASAARGGMLVLDSLHRIPGRPPPVEALAALLDLTARERGAGRLCLVVIAQQTKQGDARGSRELEHDVDGVIELEKHEVRVPKHRLGASETHARASLIAPATSTEMRRVR